MSHTQQVGYAAWGGLSPRQAIGREAADPVSTDNGGTQVGVTLDARMIVSLVLTVLGVSAGAAGAGILWGPGAALLAAGIACAVIGVMLGMGA